MITLHGLFVAGAWALGLGLVAFVIIATRKIEDLDTEAYLRLGERLFPNQEHDGLGLRAPAPHLHLVGSERVAAE